MDKVRLIANWKSNKSAEDTILFLDSLQAAWNELPMDNKEIIILPSFTSLSAAYVYRETEGLPIKLGAQNISAFDEGAYTGEVNGRQLMEFCEFVLINHSERRRYNHETDQDARSKVLQAQKYHLTPLFCVQDENGGVPDGVTEIMYEPPSSISTFEKDAKVSEVQDIERVFSVIQKRYPSCNLYYGGSVNAQNIQSLLKVPNIKGFLIGSASLNLEVFSDILQAF